MLKTTENPNEIKKIYINEFNHRVDKMVKRAISLPISFTLNAPSNYLGEATKCFINGFYNASITLARATLEQLLKAKLAIPQNDEISLGALIEKAASSKQNFLDINYKSYATKIRKWGNVYIHDLSKKDPHKSQQEKRAKEVLMSTKKIIELLYKK